MLKKRMSELEDMVMEAEEYINSIPESKVRALLTLKFIEGLTWDEAAKSIYRKMSGDSARIYISRYFEKL